MCVQFCPAEPSIIEHKIIVAAATNLIIQCNMLLIQGKLNVINSGFYLQFSLQKTLVKELNIL
jgi:hypothetical protein